MDSEVKLNEEQVYNWLKNRPDFFNDNPDLLPAAITASGKVLSLESGQLQHLQKQNEQLKDRLDGIIERINRNDEIHQTFHAIQIKMLTSETAQALIKVATEASEDLFSISRITVAINGAAPDISSLFNTSEEDVLHERLFTIDEKEFTSTINNHPAPTIRVGLEGNNRHLFFGSHSNNIRSEALVPLFSNPDHRSKDVRLIGSLNLGDGSPSRFLPSDSTDLLRDLADVLGLCLHRLASN